MTGAMADSERIKMMTGGRSVRGGLPSLPPLDIKRVARPGESRPSPPGSGGDTPGTPGSSGTPRDTPRGTKRAGKQAGKTSGKQQQEDPSAVCGEFRALGVNSPVPASHPDPDITQDDVISDGGSTSASPFPAITVDKCEDNRKEGPSSGSSSAPVRSAPGTTPDLSPEVGAVRRRDSDLLSPTPPLHRRSLDNKYTTYHTLSTSRSEGCLEYLGNIQQARETRNQRYLLETDKAASTAGIWVSGPRRASGEISPLASGPDSPRVLSISSSPGTSPLIPRKPARLMPLQYSRGKPS